ncbi:cation efflux family-domain-containing protein [Multifurca ochricompacta]|uniref:Cation efflux family-domain-containing protein n=1 Tax=Multifurca ochricompacta TaxID=376703 RepID=A0AAD4MB63_9AGAM|nr:cation efflux family-domain-containing protein [Multifurca ochricompacta]
MDLTDSRTRKKVILNPRTVLSNSISGRVATDIVFSNALLGMASVPKRGVFWVLMRVLAFGALGLFLREVVSGGVPKAFAAASSAKWTVLVMASVAHFLQQGSLLMALSQLSATRVVLFSHFSLAWAKTLSSATLTVRFAPIALGLIISFASDAGYSIRGVRETLPGYLALLLHVLSIGAFEHLRSLLVPSMGSKHASVCSTVGAAAFSLIAYAAREVLTNVPPSPVVSLFSLLAIPLAAYSTQYGRNSFEGPITTAPQYYLLSSGSALMATISFGFMWFSRLPTTTEILMGIFLSYGGYPRKLQVSDGLPQVPATQLARSHLNTIMSNSESRRIFYFLMLNLSYMMIQMLYGIWTNSLGLISDAIHMGFDCLAIGVGLFASIMATWPPNERFTYGYGRIETLSGFANGIFLILISIFIIFEAIQRLLDPPEMNTNQLLLVSTLGLGINLFGMLAMGGHAHHGHSHGHGHDHDHDHDHAHSPGHNHVHDRDDGHRHGHTHNHAPLSPMIAEHSDDLDHEDGCQGHQHDCGHTLASLDSPSHKHHRPHSPPPSATTPHSHASNQHQEVPLRPHLHPRSHQNGLLGGDGPSGPLSRAHTRSASIATFPSLPPPPTTPISHSHTAPSLASTANGHRTHSRRAPSLQIHDDSRLGVLRLQGVDPSPVTPNYRFGVDEHFASHQHAHHHGHTPNLHDHSHVHGSGHSHEGHSHNMRGLFLHVMADTLGSVGVIVSTLLIQFYGWTGFDPIASIFIAVLIAASVIPLVIDTGKVLALDVAQRGDIITDALDELASVEGLASYTNPQFWPKDASA